jgi:hypothetical protein
MFRPSDIIIDAFIDRLRWTYSEQYGDGELGHRETIAQVARMALGRLSQSNALYHNLDHTLLVTMVGHDILLGKIVRDGRVASRDWVHFVCSLLCFAIGFYRQACPGDDDARCVVDENGATVEVPAGVTDGWLWPYFTDRGKIFVRHHFADHPVLDAETLAANIEYSRFPPPVDRNPDTDTFPGLLRAAHLIGAVADPYFQRKMPALVQELGESGMTERLGYQTVAEFRAHYPELFWQMLHPLIVDAVVLLDHTGHGREWIANMHAHLLAEEHRDEIKKAY